MLIGNYSSKVNESNTSLRFVQKHRSLLNVKSEQNPRTKIMRNTGQQFASQTSQGVKNFQTLSYAANLAQNSDGSFHQQPQQFVLKKKRAAQAASSQQHSSKKLRENSNSAERSLSRMKTAPRLQQLVKVSGRKIDPGQSANSSARPSQSALAHHQQCYMARSNSGVAGSQGRRFLRNATVSSSIEDYQGPHDEDSLDQSR